MHQYTAFGIRFASELELPGVTQAIGAAPAKAIVRLGSVPESLTDPLFSGPAWEAVPGRFLLNRPEAGRFLVCDGQQLTVQPTPGVPASTVRLFLMGSAFGALMHQRQIFPLHASAVRVGDFCVAFTGISGAGKSTIAAFLEQNGYDILSDDTSAIRLLPGLGAVVFPGIPRIKLNADSFASLCSEQRRWHQPQSAYDKYEISVSQKMSDGFLPLRAVYNLCESPNGSVQIAALSGPDSLQCLVRNTYRRRYVFGLALQQTHFQTCADTLKSTQVFNLHRPKEYAGLSTTLKHLKTHWSQLTHELPLASAG